MQCEKLIPRRGRTRNSLFGPKKLCSKRATKMVRLEYDPTSNQYNPAERDEYEFAYCTGHAKQKVKQYENNDIWKATIEELPVVQPLRD